MSGTVGLLEGAGAPEVVENEFPMRLVSMVGYFSPVTFSNLDREANRQIGRIGLRE